MYYALEIFPNCDLFLRTAFITQASMCMSCMVDPPAAPFKLHFHANAYAAGMLTASFVPAP